MSPGTRGVSPSGATVVDTVPGGLLDLLLASVPADAPAALRRATGELACGRAHAAAAVLRDVGDGPVGAAWHHLAVRSAEMTLLDGSSHVGDDPADPHPVRFADKPALPPPDHPDHAVCWALVELCTGLRDLRALLPPLAAIEVSHPERYWAAGCAILQRATDVLMPGRPEAGPHLILLAADLAARSLQPERAHELLAAAAGGFVDLGDSRGAAVAAMIRGDWAAAPFASPVTWGLALTAPGKADSSVIASCEDGEQQQPDVAAATVAYDEAESRYTQAGDARGVAHVRWRRAYLHAAAGRPGEAVSLLAAVVPELVAAGDEAAAVAAGVHSVLAGLADGRWPDVEDAAAPVIAWGAGPGSTSQAVALGRMVARAGRHWMTRRHRPELALAASTIAEAIWAGMDRSLSRTQALGDQAEALAALGARSAAAVVYREVSEAHDALTGGLAQAGDQDLYRQVWLATARYTLACDDEDAEAIEQARDLLRTVGARLRERPPPAAPQPGTIDYSGGLPSVLRLVDSFDTDVLILMIRARQARDAGETAAAEHLFAEAEGSLTRLDPVTARQYLAMIRMAQLRRSEAAQLHRDWLTERLASIEARRPQAVDGAGRELLRLEERHLRHQALTFAVQADDVATARAQVGALHATGEPWGEGLGPAWQHEEVLGRLLELEGDLAAATQAFARAVVGVEAVRADLRRDDLRQAFGTTRAVQQVFHNAARVHLRLRQTAVDAGDLVAVRGHAERALRVLELGRSRALTDLLVSPSHGLPDEVVDRWRGATAQVARWRDHLATALVHTPADPARVALLRDEVHRAEQQVEECHDALRAADPRFWALAGPTSTTSPGALDPARGSLLDLVAGLPPGHAVLVYSIDRPDFLACGLTRAGMVAANWSRDERQVDRLVAQLATACQDGGAWAAPARDLATVLLEPLTPALSRATTVHVVASGPTLRVPFGVLTWDGRPLVEKAALSVLPSVSAYPLLVGTGAGGPALCVGNPAAMSYRPGPDGPALPAPSLPGAAVEAVCVARTLGGTALIGASATRANVEALLLDAGVVHLATHGVLDPASPLGSAVLLADGEQLTVAEILALRLRADLVVLSACETGTGRPARGDELLGLGRALLAAGAKSALVTLWPVDDVTAAVAMDRFHRLRAHNKLPAAGALRQATAWLRTSNAADILQEYRRLHREVTGKSLPVDSMSPARLSAVSRTVTTHPPLKAPTGHPRHWAPYVLIGR